MNKVILLGRLTKDPEIRYTQSNEPMAIAKYTLAVSRRFKKEGEPDADFILCTSFGKLAELAEKYYKKGTQLLVTGRLSVRSFDDASGQRRWVTEVLVDEAEFTESKSAFEARSSQGGQEYAGDRGYPDRSYFDRAPASAKPVSYEPEGFSAITESIDDDDLPF